MSTQPSTTIEEEIDRLRVRVEELESENGRLRAQVETGHKIVLAGVDLMTTEQVGEWAGVRSFLEQETEDYNPAGRRVAELEGALRSIAANTCCERCQEAALVARAALEPKP